MFVPSEQGTIHVFENTTERKPRVFLDISSKVTYDDKQNEEGIPRDGVPSEIL